MGQLTARFRVTRLRLDSAPVVELDSLAVEEPLEVRVDGQPFAVTMRTPGHDVELALGFLVSEGILARHADVGAARYSEREFGDGLATSNVVDVTLAPGVPAPDPSLTRSFYTTSSCGICGKASADAVLTGSAFTVADDPVRISPRLVTELPARLRAAQVVFEATGGLHAAGLFDVESEDLLVVREDVGRHNAVDKVIGWALAANRLPLRGAVLMLSGRASFELTQKALMAGIPVVAAVSAPSSLAAKLATEAGLTLIGFLRGTSMVVYSGHHRLLPVRA